MAEKTELGVYLCNTGREFASLRSLLARALESGARAVVRVREEEGEMLDKKLWHGSDSGILLPHGTATSPQADRQPILLTTEGETEGEAEAKPANGASLWFHYLAPRADLPKPKTYERMFIIAAEGSLGEDKFDQWRASGYAVRLWRQDESNRWRAEQTSEKPTE